MIHRYTLGEHVVYVQAVLTLLLELVVKTKCAKYIWVHQKIDFCSFDNNKDRIHTQEHKTYTVMDRPLQENRNYVRGFLGLTSC